MTDTISSCIPVIDIGPWRISRRSSSNHDDDDDDDDFHADDVVVQAVKDACEQVGFFAIVNHGVDPTIIERAWKASQEFFDMPMADKLQAKSRNDAEYPYGYENTEVLSVGKQLGDNQHHRQPSTESPTTPSAPAPDLKETFAIGPYHPNSGMPARRWPVTAPADFELTLSDYYQAMELLAIQLLQIMAAALTLPTTTYFETHHMDHHSSALRILNYPAISQPELSPGQLRASAHTDYGALTILKSGGPGLQVKRDIETDDWVDVPIIPDSFVINLGDMMRRWTNDKWLSTLHRVIVTPQTADRRQSIAYFCNINGDSIVDPRDMNPDEIPKYPPISAKDHLMAKHLASMGVPVGLAAMAKESKETDN